ncbi:hypothetical protein BDV23DRAFT_167284 [Aspergillus alliaceus]|uniref:Uncharacterized protein n=1 Tax=Petromyces alliaceus TaxID=209559 RepID=A0A5N7BQV4_PETAA|nr:uncharacterized protein BDW43DRAFT_264168 [Aspergillus alliaceus]KAB8237775.1 hypothetical protein BDW43DRAFT_264168 [Aspergillus alliaceus]KAE8384214.1 hypothetical protein BDV23DRAFT_167284 [Aspergillus alliaceus]
MSWVSAITAALQWILLYPITNLLYYGYGLLQLLATPLVKLGQFALRGALLPFNILLKFEAFLTFVSAAVLTGIILGLSLYYTTSLTVEVLNQSLSILRRQPQDHRVHSIKGPKTKALKRRYSLPNDYLTGSSSRPIHKGGLLSSTILEEEESNPDSNGDLYG